MDAELRKKIAGYCPRYVDAEDPITSIKALQELGISGLARLVKIEKEQGLPFGFLVTRHYAGLIDPDDLDDPIRKLVVPSMDEIEAYASQNASFDTSDEKGNRVTPGMQHKYDPTLLALVSRVCPAFCRGCFRKRLWMSVEDIDGIKDGRVFPNEESIQYIIDSKGSDKEPNAILLTGGDAFMLTNASIEKLLDILRSKELDHITTVRFGTKMVAYQPKRIDDELVGVLKRFKEMTGKQVQVSVHFDHPNEFTPETYKALGKLTDASIDVLNQTVLLKGINDNPEVLYALTKEKLADCHVRPYYIFQCRPVAGAEPFQVPLKEGVKICDEMAKHVTGPHKPNYVMSSPRGKLLITDNPADENGVYLTFHSAKPSSLTGKTFPYDVRLNPKWVDSAWLLDTVKKYAE